MKYLFLLLILCGCSKTQKSYLSESYKKYCNDQCMKDYGTEVDWVGSFTGQCYCK